MRHYLLLALSLLCACSPSTAPHPQQPAAEAPPTPENQEAGLLKRSRQLTFAGRRSGEGYFSQDGTKLIFQSEREEGNPFYQMYLLELASGAITRVSPGTGKTTCGWIHPGMDMVLFSSTHADPRAKALQQQELEQRASGKQRRYSWDYDPAYEIYVRTLSTGKLTPLAPAKGYDAEASWSPDGKLVVFASNRHAYAESLDKEKRSLLAHDPSYFIELYVLETATGAVKRLTSHDGYDGGPFFSADGRKITWRRFSADGKQAEIFTMNVDGSDERQITRLQALSWAPFFHPSGDYLIFATNLQGFENFELYLARADGEGQPQRVTYTPGFDGLPAFSPDGRLLSWTSNRSHNKTSQIFLAEWDDAAARRLLGLPPAAASTRVAEPENEAATLEQQLREHIKILASEEMQGRLTGTLGEDKATSYAAAELAQRGLLPAGDGGSYLQSFEFTAGVSIGKGNELQVSGGERKVRSFEVGKEWLPLSFSSTGRLAPAPVVFAGYGIVAPASTGPDKEQLPEYDSYRDLDVRDKYVLLLRHFPESAPERLRRHLARHASLRFKAMLARERGAKGLILVSGPRSSVERQLIPLQFDAAQAESSLAAASVTDAVGEALLEGSGRSLAQLHDALIGGEQQIGFALPAAQLSGAIELIVERRHGHNVLARLPAKEPSNLEPVIIGAHIDHLGRGQTSASLAVGDEAGKIHYGADDNASGVAAAIEIAGAIAERVRQGALDSKRDLLVGLWSGEELGLLGSSHFVRDKVGRNPHAAHPPRFAAAYLNMDMVGRLQQALVLQGIGSSTRWLPAVERANSPVGLPLALQDESYLPTDATSFYLQAVPVLSAFSGAHKEYHTPRDTEEKINYEGLARVTALFQRVAEELLADASAPDYKRMEQPAHFGERAFLRAYLGTIPDYASADIKGVKLAGVTAHAPAEAAGLRAGDIIVELAGRKIENIYDYTYAIEALKVNEPVTIVVERNGQQHRLRITPRSRD